MARLQGTGALAHIEELARIDSSVGITLAAHTSLGTSPIYNWGTEEQKQQWLPDLCAGRKLAAFGLTEPEAGSDAGNTKTRAKLEDGEWVINGAKQFITNAGTDISACVSITAVTGEGENGNKEISNIIVPNGTPGYEPGEPYRKMGWNASDTRPLSFEGCVVPEENLLGRPGRRGGQGQQGGQAGSAPGEGRWRQGGPRRHQSATGTMGVKCDSDGRTDRLRGSNSAAGRSRR
jgi:alkylation response protein AidB-like acyl-CoA dehydrogenase